jgi:hypothetical protein
VCVKVEPLAQLYRARGSSYLGLLSLSMLEESNISGHRSSSNEKYGLVAREEAVI